MALECYETHEFGPDRQQRIKTANAVIAKYLPDGFRLSVRQLFYQLVSHYALKNEDKKYKQVGRDMVDARLAGLVDWNAIEDRTRSLRNGSHWGSPAKLIKSSASWFDVDHWEWHKVVPEVWIEKDALVGVIEGICKELDIPYLSCRGYGSLSELKEAGKRVMTRWQQKGQLTLVLYLGDHDPSGLDMPRNVQERLKLFGKCGLWAKTKHGTWTCPALVRRLGLTLEQVQQYDLPPNYAKESDSRYEAYVKKYGKDCWELDALDPKVIVQLIRDAVDPLIDEEAWEKQEEKQEQGRGRLKAVADHWDDVLKYLGVSGE